MTGLLITKNNMKNFLKIALVCTLVLLMPASCRKQAVLTLSTNTVESPASGLTQAVDINTNYPWDAVVSDSWIVLHNTTGNAGESVIGVCVLSNGTGEDREGKITVTCEEIVTTITVRQSSNDALNLEGDHAEVTYAGGEIIIPIEAGSEYTVDIPVDWITDGGTRALNQYQHAITVARNESEDGRDAVITLTSATGIKKVFYVNQLGFSPTIVMTFTGEELTVPELSGEAGFSATVTWGDGESDKYVPNLKHTYAVKGEYNVVIIGKRLTGYKSLVKGVSFIDITEF